MFKENDWNGIKVTMKRDGRELYIYPVSNKKTIEGLFDISAFEVDCNDEYVTGRTYGSLMYSRSIRELAIKLYQYPNLMRHPTERFEVEQELLKIYLEKPEIQAWQDRMQEFYDTFGYYPNSHMLACAQHGTAE